MHSRICRGTRRIGLRNYYINIGEEMYEELGGEMY